MTSIMEQIMKEGNEEEVWSNELVGNLDRETLNVKELIDRKLAHLSQSERNKVFPTLWKRRDVFYDGYKPLGCTAGFEYEIKTGNAQPVRSRPYRLPESLKGVVQQHIHDMLERDVIQPSQSPWASPIVIIKKKTPVDAPPDYEPQYRFAVDYRRLNQVVNEAATQERGGGLLAYPLPRLEDTLDALGGSKIFTNLDLFSGYFQIPVAENSREKTAFVTSNSLYEFKKLPFGLSSAGSHFQLVINHVMAEFKSNVLIYLDDIVIYSETLEQHVEILDKVLEKLISVNLFVQPTKCMFVQSKIEYLGHIVSAQGVAPCPKKIECIQKYPTPKCVKEVRSFIGLVNFYRKFIKDFSKIAQPLLLLTRKDAPFAWGTSQQKAFNTLRDALITEPVLAYPDFSKPFVVVSDASQEAVGGLLAQEIDGEERPIAYYSKTLNSAQQRYPSVERELLAVIMLVKHFRPYLLNNKFKIVTDCRALKYIFSLKDPSSRLVRFALLLSQYEYEVVHRKGILNSQADALSRIKLPEESGGTELVGSVRPIWSRELVAREQALDEFCLDKIRKIKSGEDRELFKIDELNKLLYKIDPENNKLVVPKSMVYRVLHDNHDTVFSGHMGISKTLDLVRKSYFWPTMAKDITNYVSSCTPCAQRKRGNIKSAPLELVEPVKEV